ncbi:MAG TPA: hypothetical protein VFZ34_15640 [Blastocatellia bacterium]|nr:hypothetical protein [Blastocatellia bacterium]
MRSLIAVVLLLLSIPALAQDPLTGRWEGKTQSQRGEQDTTVVFKKEGDAYKGTTSLMGREVLIKDIKIAGDKMTAKADVETPQATITINYNFTLTGETMKGQGALDFGGNAMTFDMNLKRVSTNADAAAAGSGASAATARPAGGGQQRQRMDVPQPQQKQSLDYFVGAWNFRYMGRESALGPAPREGMITFTKSADGKSLNAVIEGKTDAGSYKESAVVTFDEATKQLTFSEKLANGTKLNSKGDWSSPISIRFAIDPVKIKGEALQLRRTISVVAAHSFTVTEELSEGGGPFVRLGNAVYSKVGAK